MNKGPKRAYHLAKTSACILSEQCIYSFQCSSYCTDKHVSPVCSIYNEVVACLFRLGLVLNSGRSVAVRTCQQVFLVHAPNELDSKEKVWTRILKV